ncbi:MAG: RNA pyrophosphohydrolase [Rickettsiales bacterium]|nr:RNA pyrophosphohydrolase [Pseudomonadota bacterium]MDA0966941.1 RNA pyrophosphohydrolase [Pseudomonadota bacterium]MDG4543860.1 RNA pyrophosphohydrolase [Rickettsiales bacterium]MDG4546006.1 RNA pyrophosphohydrolase [Rickettsiales bacterium]MDG4548252.1 RNA pyrophosphohydrolase [Rickettsiales bacterium]
MVNVNSLPYRYGVGMMLVNKDSQVFVGKRIDTSSEAWQMPQGGVDKGEDEKTAAFRELQEEVGTDKATLIAQSADYYYYDLPEDLIPDVWGGKFRGQKQRWFVFLFEGDSDDINIATDHPEFCEWKWINANDLPDVIVPFKRKIYSDILSEFSNLIEKINESDI